MRERALRARAGRQVADPPLQAENLAQPLDVLAGQRQLAQTGPRRTPALGCDDLIVRDDLKVVPYNSCVYNGCGIERWGPL